MPIVIVLERLVSPPPPDMTGAVRCVRCPNMCVLTQKTFAPVAARTYDPLCFDCAIELQDELEPPR